MLATFHLVLVHSLPTVFTTKVVVLLIFTSLFATRFTTSFLIVVLPFVSSLVVVVILSSSLFLPTLILIATFFLISSSPLIGSDILFSFFSYLDDSKIFIFIIWVLLERCLRLHYDLFNVCQLFSRFFLLVFILFICISFVGHCWLYTFSSLQANERIVHFIIIAFSA